MLYSASLIAYAFVQKGIEEGIPVTQMKVQKMVYFAQGVHLAIYKESLVKDIFRAWKYGPVVPAIYHAYKLYGSNPITDTDWIDQEENEEDLSTLDNKAKESIDYTWALLKDTNAVKLSNWTHTAGSPWQKNYIEGVSEAAIPNKDIQQYFESFLDK